MKVVKIILLVMLSLIFIGGIAYMIYNKRNDSANANVFKAIPEEANAIAVVNMEAFMTLFFSNIGDVWELSEDFKDNARAEDFQKEVQLSGINLTRKLAVFMMGDKFNILVPIRSTTDFTEYLDNLVTESEITSLGKRTYYHKELGAYIIFNDNLCLVSECKRSNVKLGQAMWDVVLENSKSETPISATLENLQNSKEHFALYMKEDEMAARSPMFKHSPQNITKMTFEDGRILMTSLFSTENTELSNPLLTSGNAEVESDYFSCHVNIDPESNWNYWLTDLALDDIKENLIISGNDSEKFENWDGLINFSLTGIETGIGEVISYEYNDNFEMVEKTEVKEYQQLGYIGNISFKGSIPEDLDLEKLMPSQTTYSKAEGNTYWISSKESFSSYEENATDAIRLKANPANLIDMAVDLGIPMAMMAKRFTPLAKDIEFTANPNGQTIMSELIITIPDEDKNSLIYLIGELQKINY